MVPLAVFNLYLVWECERAIQTDVGRRDARIEQDRLYTLPVINYGTNTELLPPLRRYTRSDFFDEFLD